MKKIYISIVLHICTNLFSSAQDGTLDLSFGIDGISRQNFSGLADAPRAMALTPNQKILLTGYTQTVGSEDYFIEQLTQNGMPMSNFGTSGHVIGNTFGTTDSYDLPSDIVCRPTGSSLVAMSSNGVAFLLQITNDGDPDVTFGENGKVAFASVDGTIESLQISLEDDGHALVAGILSSSSGRQLILLKYLQEGTLDESFGNFGMEISAPLVDGMMPTSIFIHADGIFVFGQKTNTTDDMCVIKFTTTATFDSTFGDGGVLTIEDSSAAEELQSLDIQTDGKIIGCGTRVPVEASSTEKDIIAFRLMPDGTLDTSFGQAGILIPEIEGQFEMGECIKALPDGKILIGGTSEFGFDMKYLIIRLEADGAFDTSFMEVGFNTTPVTTTFAQCADMAIQADGKIVLTGTAEVDNQYFITTVRYANTLTTGLDGTISASGNLRVYPNPLLHDEFTLTIPGVQSDLIDITLCDMSGKQVEQFSSIKTGSAGEVYLQCGRTLPRGMYTIRAVSGKSTYQSKLIKS